MLDDNQSLHARFRLSNFGVADVFQTGKSVLCPRSVPSTKRFIRSPAVKNHYRENLMKECVFTQPRPKADIRVLELLLRKMTVETHSAGRKSLL